MAKRFAQCCSLTSNCSGCIDKGMGAVHLPLPPPTKHLGKWKETNKKVQIQGRPQKRLLAIHRPSGHWLCFRPHEWGPPGYSFWNKPDLELFQCLLFHSTEVLVFKRNLWVPVRWLQWLRAFATKPDNLNAILGVHMMEGENWCQQAGLWPLHMYHDTHTLT